jgi:hypothetical protein
MPENAEATEVSLAHRIEQLDLHIRVSMARRTKDAEGWEHDAYRVVLKRGDQTLTMPFRMGTGHRGSPPQLVDVLDALISDAANIEQTDGFEDWASGLDYDTDSRQAEKVYNACLKVAADLKRLVGDEEVYEDLLYRTERL